MKELYKEWLFGKKILVAEGASEARDAASVLVSLASLFQIRIVEGGELAEAGMIRFVSRQLGTKVPEPFYRGFPDSVRRLAPDQLLLDQLLHYVQTYGLNRFDEAGHSLLETYLERTAFHEKTDVRDYRIITKDRAEKLIREAAGQLLMSTRPLNDRQYALLLASVMDGYEVTSCASRNTAVRLLLDTRDIRLARLISMQDMIRLTDELNARSYGNQNIKKLNLRNQDRKFLTAVMDRLFALHRCDLPSCCEKKAVWCGLLHHLHYQPKTAEAERFVACMRGRQNLSVYASFEKAMKDHDIPKAVEVLKQGKGTSAVLRSMDYLLSRCGSDAEAARTVSSVGSENTVLLIQLLIHYAAMRFDRSSRCFRFTRYNRLKVHAETREETERRRSRITPERAAMAADAVDGLLSALLRGRIRRAYIDPEMKKTALPLQENTAQGGPGVLAKGSRMAIGAGKKIRAFTYWEKVNDIDLSVIGLDEAGYQTEFSWRTMADLQSDALTFSGDETSGYSGGSEFFDLDPVKFRKLYPRIRYLVFCDNVYSDLRFSQCLCRAGFMVRDREDSGEIFEPKTVASSFQVNCESRFAYLFGIDLRTREFVWLNAARNSAAAVAGAGSLAFLLPYFHVLPVMNLYRFFEMMADELTDNPDEADIIVSDRLQQTEERAGRVIRSYDFERILAWMNQKPPHPAETEGPYRNSP